MKALFSLFRSAVAFRAEMQMDTIVTGHCDSGTSAGGMTNRNTGRYLLKGLTPIPATALMRSLRNKRPL